METGKRPSVYVVSNDLIENCYEVAAAEVVVKGCSLVLGLLTTGRPDSYVTVQLYIEFNKIRKASCQIENAWRPRFWPTDCMLDTTVILIMCLIIFILLSLL